MSNRREHLQNRLDKRREWADKAEAKSSTAFRRVGDICESIPFGQPILVGHHSERHARRDQDRIQSGMEKGTELHNLANQHNNKADGLAVQLDRSIFSDDQDAIQQLEARIVEREAEAAQYGEINKAWRKAKGDVSALVASGLVGEKLAATITQTMRLCPWLRVPLGTTNIRASIRRDKERLDEIKAMQTRTDQAEQAGGVTVEVLAEGYARVTFAEKPVRSIIDSLKAAGYWWGRGSWFGKRDQLPEGFACTEEDAQLVLDQV